MRRPFAGLNELLEDYWLPDEWQILQLHDEVIQPGELVALRDMTMLGSAVARPSQLLSYQGDQPVYVLASVVSIGLVNASLSGEGSNLAWPERTYSSVYRRYQVVG